jgi:hypothetical protein
MTMTTEGDGDDAATTTAMSPCSQSGQVGGEMMPRGSRQRRKGGDNYDEERGMTMMKRGGTRTE